MTFLIVPIHSRVLFSVLYVEYVWNKCSLCAVSAAFILNMVRCYFDYGSSVWSPYSKCDIEDLEKVQKRATRVPDYCPNSKAGITLTD